MPDKVTSYSVDAVIRHFPQLEIGDPTSLDKLPLLFELMTGLKSIRISNVDAKWGFSIIQKIYTDQKSSLKQATIIALISVK